MSTNQQKVEEPKQPIVDWEPAPGQLLIKTLKREEVAALYGRGGVGRLSLPDNVGKVSDSVGVGRVVKMGNTTVEVVKNIISLHRDISQATKEDLVRLSALYDVAKTIAPGDYVAYLPYTDLIIEIDGQKYSLLPYAMVRGVRKGKSDGKPS